MPVVVLKNNFLKLAAKSKVVEEETAARILA